MPQSKVLGILGGLGPMATVYFYQLITQHTAAQTDQEHLDILISSRASTPDRTGFILGQTTQNPLPVLQADARRLVQAGAEVLAMPCNTAHYFYTGIANGLTVPLLNMIEATVARAKQAGSQKVGLLATTGTVDARIYQAEFEKQGLAWAVPDEEGQNQLMQLIYNDIKAGRPPNMQNFFGVVNQLEQQGCSHFILGCTELSLLQKNHQLSTSYISSLDVLAHAAIVACGKTPTGFTY